MMRRLRVCLLIAIGLVLSVRELSAEQYCGSSTPFVAQLAVMANVANILCEGVGELSDHDTGIMFLSAGARLGPQCEIDHARLVLEMKAMHAKDADAWCTASKHMLSEHPLTKPLVTSAAGLPTASCNELDRAAALVTTAESVCGYVTSAAGKTVQKIVGSKSCFEAELSAMRGRAKAASAARVGMDKWCGNLLADHHNQFDALNLPRWFDVE